MSDGLVRLEKKDLGRAATMLARAFRTYPMVTDLFDDTPRTQRMLKAFMGMGVAVCLRYGEVYATSERLEGVAGWLPPGTAPIGGRAALRAAPLSVLFRFACNGGARMRKVGEHIDAMHRQHAPFPHWYLQVIGVEPDEQGKGFSSQLIRPMLERFDGEGLPCFLDTDTEKNVHIYERFGFRVVAQGTVPGTDIRNWFMVREAGGQTA